MEREKQDQVLDKLYNQETNVLAILSFTFSIFSLSFIFIFLTTWVADLILPYNSVFFEIIGPFAIVTLFVSIILVIISFVMGLFGKRKERYKNLSIAGIYISLFSLIGTIVSIIITILKF